MSNLLRFLFYVVAALFGLSYAAEDASGPVPMLTSSNFDTFLETHPIVLVKFMAPWCGHCKKLAPEYEGAAVELTKAGSIPLVEVDATQDSELAKKYNVQGFPTLFLFRDGKPEPYSGGRTKAAIVEWVEKMTGPAVEWLESKSEIAEKTKDFPVAFVGTVPSKKHESAITLEAVAGANRMKGRYFAVVDSSATEGTIAVHRQKEETITTKIESKEKLEAWCSAEAVPYLGPIGGENYPLYAARSKNWVWFAGVESDYETHGPTIRKVSKNYRTDFNFVWLNTDELKQHAEGSLGLKTFPSIALVWEDAKYHYEGEITEKGFTKFIEAVKAGKVKRFLKSEPVPEKNDGPVKVVVGSQFSEMVLQKDKDVFLEIYAPWCGHCKKLSPIWEELGERTQSSKNFLVANFDGTANEPDAPDFEFHGFPTIYFIKAGSKTPMAYDGERNLESFLSFAKKHAAFPITVSDEDEGKDKDEL